MDFKVAHLHNLSHANQLQIKLLKEGIRNYTFTLSEKSRIQAHHVDQFKVPIL